MNPKKGMKLNEATKLGVLRRFPQTMWQLHIPDPNVTNHKRHNLTLKDELVATNGEKAKEAAKSLLIDFEKEFWHPNPKKV